MGSFVDDVYNWFQAIGLAGCILKDFSENTNGHPWPTLAQ